MKNSLSVAPQGDGTQTWTNLDSETGAQIVYQFVPVATLHAGDSIATMRQFAPGSGTTRNESARVLSAQDITDLAAHTGSFVRVKEL